MYLNSLNTLYIEAVDMLMYVWQAHTWFLKIVFAWEVGMHVCLSVCSPPITGLS